MPKSGSRYTEPGSAFRSGAIQISPIQLAPVDLEIHRCLDRLDAVLADEHRALKDMSPSDLYAINARKSALLLELDRGQRTHKVMTLDPETIKRLRDVREKLGHNMQQISRHIEALNEVLRVVRKSVESNEADGTYSRTIQTDAWIK